MGEHSIVEATNQLPALIGQALAGEEIIITRRGKPVATLRPAEPRKPPAPPRMTPTESVAWLRAHRVGQIMSTEDAGTTSAGCATEEWEK